MSDLGTVTHEGDTRTAHFERRLPFAPEEVWAALTEPDHMKDWLTAATFDAQVGGEARFDFGEGGVCHGEVLTCDRPSVLEYEWIFAHGHRSVVRWTLTGADDGETALEFEHRLLEADNAIAYATGWHAHLDQLAADLTDDAPPPDWGERYTELRPRYDAANS